MALGDDIGNDQTDGVYWNDGVPVSARFDDPYYSLNDGWAETSHVFLAGNRLPERFRPGFHIGELGFGTGLNVLVALHAWRSVGVRGPLRFTSFEAFPLDHETIEAALARFPETKPYRDAFLHSLAGNAEAIPDLELNIVVGDARQTLPVWDGLADAWFLDGFSPAKNPELWEDDLLGHVAGKTSPHGTAATYTAAGHVRRSLEAAGFDVQRVSGFGRKRHMTRAILP